MRSGFLLWQSPGRNERAETVICCSYFPPRFSEWKIGPFSEGGKMIRRVAPACLLALTMMPAALSADPVPVTSGFFSVTGLGASAIYDFQGLDFQAAASLEPGVVGPDLTCFPCVAGAVISLDTSFLGSRGTGSAVVDGMTFPSIGLAATNFLFEAPDIVAPGTTGSFAVMRPFTFSGRLFGFALTDPDLTPIFEPLLIGQGQVTASFLENPNPGGPPLFSFRSIRFDFAEPAPVPEPATLLLVASGLGGALLRRRARRTS
jgi:hypothetical protein